MKNVRRLFPLALAALLAAGPLAAALPDAEMAGADGSAIPAGPEKKPAPKSGAAARKHRARSNSDKRAPHNRARGAAADRSSSLAPAASSAAKDSSSRPG